LLGAVAATACNGGYYSPGALDTADPIERETAADSTAAGTEGTGTEGDDDGDTDADGGPKLDVKVDAEPPVAHEIVVYRGLSNGDFEAAVRFYTADDTVGLLALPAANGLGDDLLVAARPSDGAELRRYTKPLEGPAHAEPIADSFDAWATGDLDDDGDADLVVADESSVRVYLAGSISVSLEVDRALPASSPRPRALAITDLDDDGLVEVVLAAGWHADSCGVAPIAVGVISDITASEDDLPPLDEYQIVESSDARVTLSTPDLDLDGQRDLVVAADFAAVLRFGGAGNGFQLPVTLGAAVERVVLRARPQHDAFDVVVYADDLMLARRIEDSGLVDVATATLAESPWALASFDARPSAAAVGHDRKVVTIYDRAGADLVVVSSLTPDFAGEARIEDVIAADFDGDGVEDLALDVAYPPPDGDDDASTGVGNLRIGNLPRCPPP